MEDIVMICCQIISKVGEAKSLFVEAMRKARKKEYNNVNELMKKGEQLMLEGQRIHAQMLQKSASKDDNLEINLFSFFDFLRKLNTLSKNKSTSGIGSVFPTILIR